MTVLNRILLATILFLGSVGLGEYIVLRTARTQLDRVQATLAAAQSENDSLRGTLRSTNAALSVRAKAIAKAQTQVAAARKDLDHAIQSNPGWSSTAVPDAVWDSLYGPAPKAVPSSRVADGLP